MMMFDHEVRQRWLIEVIGIMEAGGRVVMSEQQMLERIVIDPKVMVGKPVIKGTRLTVEYILGLLAHGATFDEIVEEYRDITPEDIQVGGCFVLLESWANQPVRQNRGRPVQIGEYR
jgi:uncharacterized protein (DUF433 family)